MLSKIRISSLGKPIASWWDSRVFHIPWWEGTSLIKAYYGLSVSEIQEYHRIHAQYAEKWEIVVPVDLDLQELWRKRNFQFTFLWSEIRGVAMHVLWLDPKDVAENKEWYVLARVPYVRWSNLLSYWNQELLKKGEEAGIYLVEKMVHTGLQNMWLVFQKRERGTWNLIQEWHTIGRENIMIEWTTAPGIIKATVTDIGMSVRHAVNVERYNESYQQNYMWK